MEIILSFRIFACATMWHETKSEMMEMLKSLFRMDEDQSARRVAQKYLKVVDADYYEFESESFVFVKVQFSFLQPEKYHANSKNKVTRTP